MYFPALRSSQQIASSTRLQLTQRRRATPRDRQGRAVASRYTPLIFTLLLFIHSNRSLAMRAGGSELAGGPSERRLCNEKTHASRRRRDYEPPARVLPPGAEGMGSRGGRVDRDGEGGRPVWAGATEVISGRVAELPLHNTINPIQHICGHHGWPGLD